MKYCSEFSQYLTMRDFADVGFGLITFGVIPGPVDEWRSTHAHTAFTFVVAGLPWAPVCVEHWPPVCPRVRITVRLQRKIHITFLHLPSRSLACQVCQSRNYNQQATTSTYYNRFFCSSTRSKYWSHSQQSDNKKFYCSDRRIRRNGI